MLKDDVSYTPHEHKAILIVYIKIILFYYISKHSYTII